MDIWGLGYDKDGNFGNLNDFWYYSIENKTWNWVTGSNTCNSPGSYGTKGIPVSSNTPGARRQSNSYLNEQTKSFYIFGGYGIDANSQGI